MAFAPCCWHHRKLQVLREPSISAACRWLASERLWLLQVEVRKDGAVRRRYRAKGLTSQGPRDLIFFNEQAGRDMSVLEYFELTYHIQCAFIPYTVHQPCPPDAGRHAAYGLMPAFSCATAASYQL